MRNLTNDDLHQISGGSHFLVTQNVSTDGISPSCVNTLANIFQPDTLNAFSEEELLIKLITNCKFSELELLDERMENTPFLTINFVQ